VDLEGNSAGPSTKLGLKENATIHSPDNYQHRTPTMMKNEFQAERLNVTKVNHWKKYSDACAAKLEGVEDQRQQVQEIQQIQRKKRLLTSAEIDRIRRSNSNTLPEIQRTEHTLLKEDYEQKNVPIKPCICQFGKWAYDPKCEWPFHKPALPVDGLWWKINGKQVGGVAGRKIRKRQRSRSESSAESPRTVKRRDSAIVLQ
jgi:hypothetical protein